MLASGIIRRVKIEQVYHYALPLPKSAGGNVAGARYCTPIRPLTREYLKNHGSL